MSTTTTKGSGNTKNDGGTVLAGGNVGSTRFNNLSTVTNVTAKLHRGNKPYPFEFNGIESVILGTGVAITAITQSGSTGYVNIAKSTHGLSVGDLLAVYAADVAVYNTTHRVTVVTDANNIQTDVFYTTDTISAHGSYKPFSGDFNKMTKNRYIGTVIGAYVAGTATSIMRITGADSSFRYPIFTAKGNQRYNITGWDYVTGAATKGASAGATVQYIDPAGGGAVTSEPFPSRAVPGELVYTIGTNVPKTGDYSAKTE